jgi:alpha-D-xyloside xylohydrolase
MSSKKLDWVRTPHGVRSCCQDITIEMTAYGASCVRVSAWHGPDRRLPSLAITAAPEVPAGAEWIVDGGTACFRSPAGAVAVDISGSVRVKNADGQLCFTEQAAARLIGSGGVQALKKGAAVAATFQIPEGVGLYGLGQYTDSVMDRRGSTVEMVQGNTQVVVPFLVTSAGWGLLWDQPGPGQFADNADGTRFTAVSGRALDYTVCLGSSMDEAVAGYRHLTGRAALLPKWAFGYWQSKERYKSAKELEETVTEFRARKFPLDVIVQDWEYWGDRAHWSSMVHNPKTYGDLPGAVKRIHDRQAHVVISIWPALGPETEIFKELEAAGHLFEMIHWSTGRVYDPFSEEARKIYWKHAKKGLWDNGIDGFWMDATEPEYGDPFCGGLNSESLMAEPKQPARGTWAESMSAYCLETTHGIWECQREDRMDKRVCILTRSGWAGQQRYGAITWSGDISASWQMLRTQITAGLHFCMAGIPFWTTDIGGFFPGFRGGQFPKGVEDPAYRELYVRWFQYGAFCPIFRSHGTQTPREPWQFGEPGDAEYDTLLAFDRLRYRLLPYHYTLAGQACHRGGTPMRALAMDFPDDPRSRAQADEFMCGPALLVAPVLEAMYHDPEDAMPVIPPEGLIMSSGVTGRIQVRHFQGRKGDGGEVYANAVDAVDFSFAGSAPAGLEDEDYQIQVTGALVPFESGTHRILVRADGDIRLRLDGKVVIDSTGDSSEVRTEACTVEMTKGRICPLELEYGHGKGKGSLQLGWVTPSQSNAPAAAQRPKERRVYLPPAIWYDFWTGERFDGGREIVRPATLDTMPLLVRAGSVLPMGPEIEWVDQQAADPIELRVYAGADGDGELYEDAGDDYDYEQGKWSVIPWTWSEREQTLTIGARQGEFDGMLTFRRFRIVRVQPGKGVGIESVTDSCQEIAYDGQEVRVKLA